MPVALVMPLLYVVLALVAGGGAWFGVHHYNDSLRQEGFTKAEQQYKPQVERAQAQLAQAETERKRLESEQQQLSAVAHDARTQLDAVGAANADLVRSGERLRLQLSAALRAPRAPDAHPAAGGSQAAQPAPDLLADVQQRLAEAEDSTVRFADQSHIAGLACERAYEVK